MKIDMKEFIVAKNEKGELNLDSLKMAKKEEAPKEKKEAKSMEMLLAVASTLCPFSNDMTGNNHSLNFGRALSDFQKLLIAVKPLNRKFLH